MKKTNFKNLKLNKSAISSFQSDYVNGGGAHSGLELTCPNICVVTKNDGPICNPQDQ